MSPIISVSNLNKTYASGLQALKRIDLQIRKGEIFALLGPNGAGKTTLISIVCGIVTPTEGTVRLFGRDPSSGAPRLGELLQYVHPDDRPVGLLPVEVLRVGSGWRLGRERTEELIRGIGELEREDRDSDDAVALPSARPLEVDPHVS